MFRDDFNFGDEPYDLDDTKGMRIFKGLLLAIGLFIFFALLTTVYK